MAIRPPILGVDGDELVTAAQARMLYGDTLTRQFLIYDSEHEFWACEPSVAQTWPGKECLYSMSRLDYLVSPSPRGYPFPYLSPEPRRHAPTPKLPDTPDALITTAQAAELVNRERERSADWREPFVTIRPGTIRQWVARGHLTVAQVKTEGGRANLYRVADVRRAAAQAEAKTRCTVDQGQNLPAAVLGALLSTAEAASLAGVAPSTVRMWAKRGKLTPAEPGTRPKYRAADVLSVIRESRRP